MVPIPGEFYKGSKRAQRFHPKVAGCISADACGGYRGRCSADSSLTGSDHPKTRRANDPWPWRPTRRTAMAWPWIFALAWARNSRTICKKFRVSEITTKNMKNFMRYYQSSVTKWLLVNAKKFNFYP